MKHLVKSLESLCTKLLRSSNEQDKLRVLDQYKPVQDYLYQNQTLKKFLNAQDLKFNLVIKSIIAIGQGHRLLDDIKDTLIIDIVETLLPVEKFYQPIGGIVGYHLNFIKLVLEAEKEENIVSKDHKSQRYLEPPHIDLTHKTKELWEAIRLGIDSLPKMAEIYVVGGAGDRLNLMDEQQCPLPVAQLFFSGKTLLEGLIQDLQAREYLYYKLNRKQVTVPIVMMTSREKNNYQNIMKICSSQNWFGRSLESFKLFIQPLVPVITIKGDWAIFENGSLMLKPGGHGVIWKLAKDNGIFQFLIEKEIHKAVVRQINNPIAGVDYNLLAFTGIGFKNDKAFGFCSCARRLNTAEGMLILIEEETKNGYSYAISNIEYTDFIKKGIQDLPIEKGSIYSAFPANTNILFIDLEDVQEAVESCPIPGMVINMKTSVTTLNETRSKELIPAGRLESLMQNLADVMNDCFPTRLTTITPDLFKTFLTYNDRKKTISVTKKAYLPAQSILETPEGCFYDLLVIYRELLTKECEMQLPEMSNEQDYLEKGPSFIFSFHPALGPLFSIISQKIHGGKLSEGSELHLEIAELELNNLDLEGSLSIVSDSIMGHRDQQGNIQYSENNGKCILKNVKVINKGIDRKESHLYWKGDIRRHERLSITLDGNAEFYCENATFVGDQHIHVPHQHQMFVHQENGQLFFDLRKIEGPTWYWRYSFDPKSQICLTKNFV